MLGYQRRESLGSGGGGSNQYGHVGGMSNNPMVNPGESGVLPMASGGSGSHGGFMPPESQLVLNSMNTMLSSGSSVDVGRGGWSKGPSANEMRPMDWISQSRRGKPLDLQENPLICTPAPAASVKATGGQKGDRTEAVGFSAAVDPSQRHGGLSSSNQMVTPWNVSVVPLVGAGTRGRGSFVSPTGGRGGSLVGEGGGGTSISHFNQMGNPESNIPLNNMGVMLPTGPPMDEGRGGWNSGPPPNEMRQMDWISHSRRGQNVGMEEKHMMRQRSHSFGQAGRQMMTEQQFRKTTMANRGKPIDNKGSIKDLKKRKNEDVKVFTKDQKKQRSEAMPTGGEKKTKSDSSEKKTKGDSSISATGLAKDQKKQKSEETPALAGGQKDEVKGDPKHGDLKHSGKEDKAEQECLSPDENETMDDGSQKGGVEPLIPKEALKCHVCEYYDFNSVKGFMNHLLSKNHEIIAHAYHAKGAAMLHLLKVQSKLAAQRYTLKSQKMGMRARITECTKCQCPVFGNLVEHMKTREHMMVSDYTKCALCQILFDNRISLENHRLSLRHLQESHSVTEEVKGQLEQVEKNLDEHENQMEVNVDQHTLEKAVKIKKNEDGQNAEGTSKDDAVDQLKITHKDTLVWNVKYIPSYDPAVPTGLNFIEKEALFYCKVCQIKTMKTAREAHAHFCTPEHYENFVAYLKKLKENKELEKIKQEKLIKEEKEETGNTKKENDQTQDSTQVKVEPKVEQSSDVVDIMFEDDGEDGEDISNIVERMSDEGDSGRHKAEMQAKEGQMNDDECNEEASGDFDDILSMLEEVGEALPEDDETKKNSQSLPDTEDQESVTGDEEETVWKNKAADGSVDEEPTLKKADNETETGATEKGAKAVSSPSAKRGKGKGRSLGSRD
ncbi:uncharacterized protein [Panulirus ornatus]|uniref:uncharacterized protein isoform X1 n=2 Tax=Panulirus ornatus TaxID=150431 RepID=UPI003A849F59